MRDTHYRVEGPVVSQLQAVFDDNWMQTTGEVLQGDEFFPELHAKGKQWAQVFKSSFTGGSENMQLLFLLSIAAAGSEIRIENAYFVPDDLTIRSLTAAAQRGVHVTIIVPGIHIDANEVRQASRSLGRSAQDRHRNLGISPNHVSLQAADRGRSVGLDRIFKYG